MPTREEQLAAMKAEKEMLEAEVAMLEERIEKAKKERAELAKQLRALQPLKSVKLDE